MSGHHACRAQCGDPFRIQTEDIGEDCIGVLPQHGRCRGRRLLIGPFFSGFTRPAHVVIPSVTPRGIFNMSAFLSAEIHRARESR